MQLGRPFASLLTASFTPLAFLGLRPIGSMFARKGNLLVGQVKGSRDLSIDQTAV
jgi:hypothetical protein